MRLSFSASRVGLTDLEPHVSAAFPLGDTPAVGNPIEEEEPPSVSVGRLCREGTGEPHMVGVLSDHLYAPGPGPDPQGDVLVTSEVRVGDGVRDDLGDQQAG